MRLYAVTNKTRANSLLQLDANSHISFTLLHSSASPLDVFQSSATTEAGLSFTARAANICSSRQSACTATGCGGTDRCAGAAVTRNLCPVVVDTSGNTHAQQLACCNCNTVTRMFSFIAWPDPHCLSSNCQHREANDLRSGLKLMWKTEELWCNH